MASYHSSIVVNDCIQVVDGGLLHFIFLANTELTQIQIPKGQEGKNQLRPADRNQIEILPCIVILPDREVNHVVDLVPPDEAPEGEAFELDDQNVWQTPQQQLFGGLSVLLALWTVPKKQTEQ